mgnify:CR=1 FL=1
MNFNDYSYDKNTHLKIYKALIKPRMIEEKMLKLLRQGQVSKWFSGIGQEAISVGVTLALEPDEYIMPLHRNLGVFTTRGIPIKKLHKSLSKKERAPGFLPDHKEMEAADRKSFHVTQADLLKLAEDRARTLRELLITQSGINASRIEINAPAESTSTRVRIAFDVAKN